MGIEFFKRLYASFKISAEDAIKWGINLIAVGGWGETKTPEINVKKKFYKVILNGGAEGKAFGKVGYAVDQFARGCYAAGATVIFGTKCDAIETHCISAGSPICEFVSQATEKFDKKDPLVENQLNIPKI